MSTKKYPRSHKPQQTSKDQLPKASVWQCPSRSSLNPLGLQKEQEDILNGLLKSVIARKDGSSGTKDNEVLENRRLRRNVLTATTGNYLFNSLKGPSDSAKQYPGYFRETSLKCFQPTNATKQSRITSIFQRRAEQITSQFRMSNKRKAPLSSSNFNMTRIPEHLTAEERGVYEKLIIHKKSSSASPARVVVITDLAKDYDDLAAMVLLKELHRLGLIKLEGFIANLHPPQERACFGRQALDLLGLKDIPIAWGEEAQADPAKRKAPHAYEFEDCDFMEKRNFDIIPYNQPKPNRPGRIEIESGVMMIDRLVKETISKPCQPKLTFLLLSGLADMATYAKREPELLARATAKIILQGEYTVERPAPHYQATIMPNLKAANNGFDEIAAAEFHQYMQRKSIPSTVWTRFAATGAAMSTQLFNDLAATKHAIGVHLQKIQGKQDLLYYDNACNGPRFMPHMDQYWFLRGKTSWYDPDHPERANEGLPVGKEVLKYVNVVIYDALAALGTAGEEVLDLLEVLHPAKLLAVQGPYEHKVVGTEKSPQVDKWMMGLALSALMKGSLWACQEGISSN